MTHEFSQRRFIQAVDTKNANKHTQTFRLFPLYSNFSIIILIVLVMFIVIVIVMVIIVDIVIIMVIITGWFICSWDVDVDVKAVLDPFCNL